MILLIGILSWNNGRIYCNTVCPVGTFLGLISKFSIYQIRFDKVKCTLCGKCARECKASCIDFRNMKVDTSRCINCFNCIEACSENGLQYKSSIMGHSREKADNHQHNSEVSNVTFNNRRRFLTLTFATSLLSIKLFADKVLHLGEKKDVKRKKPIMPPGAMDINKFSRQCTSCHLCVSKCPAQIIEPSLFEYGIGGIMQPMLNFTNQFCNYDCTICTDVCPTGALSSITKETKHHTQIGRVQLYLENCIVYTDETSCGACSEHCPTQAVHMIPYKNHLTIPEINQEICVGCGGCEFICPALPWKAIFVEGQDKHTNIVLEFEKKEEIELDDFGF
jgi:ferredoxin